MSSKPKLFGNDIRIFVHADGKKKQIIISKKRILSDLADKVSSHVFGGKLKPNQFYMVCAGTSFEDEENDTRLLEELKISNDAVVSICMRASGGGKNLRSLPGYIKLTSTEPCCVSFDDSPDKMRAKMPCGCVISPEMMKHYSDTVISDGNFRFFCSNCTKEWQYFLVRHVLSAILSRNQLIKLGTKINENYFGRCPGVQQCPTCHNNCERDVTKKFWNKNRVVCPLYTGRQGSNVEFCWSCLKAWRGDLKSCGNEGCTGEDTRLIHLKTCETKKIKKVDGVPTVRGCGKCGNLIYHTGGCKHMKCRCGNEFCFVCLKPRLKETCQWQCGGPCDVCPVAPRQTKLVDF